jgi:pseudouridylate synthase I
MRNIRLILEYDGTEFAGWQTQKAGTRTVQQTIEHALKRILCEKIKLTGSGRTDSGVHAAAQVANFKTKSKLSIVDIKRALNAVLPTDIAIKEAKKVSLSFHSRFDAKSKVYRYALLNSPEFSVVLRNFYYFYPYQLNLAAMRKAAKLLVGRKDFKSFQAADKIDRSSKRAIKKLIIKKQGNFIYFDIEADGFLYKMARNIVGTLLEAGRGRLKPKDIPQILRQKNRKFAGPTLPAKGLTLLKVNY